MYSSVTTAVLHGMDAVLVKVEADVSAGLPTFEMVGFLAAEVKEAKERVRTALKNCGFPLPAKRITISFSPAGIRKSGSGLDLAVAVAILAALGVVSGQKLAQMIFLGELNLNGKVVPVPGVLPVVAKALESGYLISAVPEENWQEASLVSGMEHVGFSNLKQVADWLNGKEGWQGPGPLHPDAMPGRGGNAWTGTPEPDFSEINGQKLLKRACEIAVAGRHHLLMLGPPGAGKTMAARRIPSILPPMSEQEKMEVSKLYSICGMLDEKEGLISKRPFRSPHHMITPQGLTGGGSVPRPGEISLAHKGVLFLDELTEYKMGTLDVLRQPLEDHKIQIVRTHGKYTFPADFMLVAAMNPCGCGYYPDMQKCHCTGAEIRKYRNRVSQPILDRIDLCVKVSKIEYEDLRVKEGQESSAKMRERVMLAGERQEWRYREYGYRYNSQIPANRIAAFCGLGREAERQMRLIYDSFGLSARSYHKLLKTARTIADLEDSEDIQMEHLNEAICYRTIDRNFWEDAE